MNFCVCRDFSHVLQFCVKIVISDAKRYESNLKCFVYLLTKASSVTDIFCTGHDRCVADVSLLRWHSRVCSH